MFRVQRWPARRRTGFSDFCQPMFWVVPGNDGGSHCLGTGHMLKLERPAAGPPPVGIFRWKRHGGRPVTTPGRGRKTFFGKSRPGVAFCRRRRPQAVKPRPRSYPGKPTERWPAPNWSVASPKGKVAWRRAGHRAFVERCPLRKGRTLFVPPPFCPRKDGPPCFAHRVIRSRRCAARRKHHGKGRPFLCVARPGRSTSGCGFRLWPFAVTNRQV